MTITMFKTLCRDSRCIMRQESELEKKKRIQKRNIKGVKEEKTATGED